MSDSHWSTAVNDFHENVNSPSTGHPFVSFVPGRAPTERGQASSGVELHQIGLNGGKLASSGPAASRRRSSLLPSRCVKRKAVGGACFCTSRSGEAGGRRGRQAGPIAGSEARNGQMHPPPATFPGVCAGTVDGTVSHGDQPRYGDHRNLGYRSNFSFNLAPFGTEG